MFHIEFALNIPSNFLRKVDQETIYNNIFFSNSIKYERNVHIYARNFLFIYVQYNMYWSSQKWWNVKCTIAVGRSNVLPFLTFFIEKLLVIMKYVSSSKFSNHWTISLKRLLTTKIKNIKSNYLNGKIWL